MAHCIFEIFGSTTNTTTEIYNSTLNSSGNIVGLFNNGINTLFYGNISLIGDTFWSGNGTVQEKQSTFSTGQ